MDSSEAAHWPERLGWLAAVRAEALDDAGLGTRLANALTKGAVGVLLEAVPGPEVVTRLDARLGVAEAMLGRPDGGARIAALIGSAAGAASLVRFGRPSERLVTLGLDGAALAQDLGLPPDPSVPALVVARGWTVIAARVAGVPAFTALPAEAPRLPEAEAVEGFAGTLTPATGGEEMSA